MLKVIQFLGSSQRDLREFPDKAKESAGHELMRVQSGLDPVNWKPFATVGSNVREIRIRQDSSGPVCLDSVPRGLSRFCAV